MSLFELNEKQKQATQHVEGPMLILAGAGSGKTRVVTERIMRLLDLGTLASDILAVTFTNKAADEMKRRVKKQKNVNILTCTFHSLGARILRESIQLLGYTPNFTIYDEDDSLKLLKSCLVDLGIKEEKGLSKKLKTYISAAKNDLLDPTEIPSSSSKTKTDQIFEKVYPIYQAFLKTSNAVDFDDLLFLPVKLLKENPSLLHEYQNRWLFLLIDEYQDTNYAQYILIKLLAEKHKNIFAVGDPDQSIYSWRGARYQNILNFEQDFPGAKVIKLEQNYRSSETILNASNALISNNEERYEKKLWSSLGKGNKIGVFIAQTDQEEAKFVVNKLSEVCSLDDISFNDMVIFYRTNAQSRVYEDALLANQIPYKIIGGLSFYQRKEIKDVLAILRLIGSNSDVIAFSRVLFFAQKGIGAASFAKIQKGAEKAGKTLFSFLQDFAENPLESNIKLQSKQQQGLLNFVNKICHLRAFNGPISEVIKECIETFSYLDVIKEDPEKFEDRKENLEELINKAHEWESVQDEPSLLSFLEELSLKADQSSSDEASSIKLMTVHNGKGLEFSLVFIVGLEENLFPHANSKDNPESLEEERRLCYVAMTRAKKHLFLCSSSYRYLWGSPRLMAPSRFLKEIPAQYLENFSPASLEKPVQESAVLVESIDNSCFSNGEKVIHKEFGKGVIRKIYQTSFGTTYDVYFVASNSTRSLVAKYAKLERFVS